MQQEQTARRAAAAALGAARCAAVRIGLGARIITAAVRRRLARTGTEDEVDIQLHRLGEMVYATHTGTPTDSGALLAQMKKVDAAVERLRTAEAGAGARRCPVCGGEADGGDAYCGACGQKL